jgi:hypothetical protein
MTQTHPRSGLMAREAGRATLESIEQAPTFQNRAEWMIVVDRAEEIARYRVEVLVEASVP